MGAADGFAEWEEEAGFVVNAGSAASSK